jgi:hypothetical protein
MARFFHTGRSQSIRIHLLPIRLCAYIGSLIKSQQQSTVVRVNENESRLIVQQIWRYFAIIF